MEEVKEEEKGESKSNAARKKLPTCTPTAGLRLCAETTVFKVEMLPV